MIILKSKGELDAMAEAGKIAADVLRAMQSAAVIGVTTKELDDLAISEFEKRGARPALLGYKPPFMREAYQFATCISINEEAIHGLPSSRALQDGDTIGLDTVAELDGWYADTAITVQIGSKDDRTEMLLLVTEDALLGGIKGALSGRRIGDISATIGDYVKRYKFTLLKEFRGHGIGRCIHELGLDVANEGSRGTGLKLMPGMTFCIEPMVSAGSPNIKFRDDDPWTVLTKDGSKAAHFEHTVAVTEDGPIVLTLPSDVSLESFLLGRQA